MNKIEGSKTFRDDGYGKKKVRFPAHKLGLVERDGTIRILRGNSEVATSPLAGARLESALLVDEISAIGMGTDPTTIQFIPVTL